MIASERALIDGMLASIVPFRHRLVDAVGGVA